MHFFLYPFARLQPCSWLRAPAVELALREASGDEVRTSDSPLMICDRPSCKNLESESFGTLPRRFLDRRFSLRSGVFERLWRHRMRVRAKSRDTCFFVAAVMSYAEPLLPSERSRFQLSSN